MKKILAVLLILSVSFVVAGCNNVFSMTKESTTESTTNETATDDNTTEETTTEEYYWIIVNLNNDETDYMIENGYAEMVDDGCLAVHRSLVMEELLDWGDISSEKHFHSHGGSDDCAMSWTFINLKCDRETADKIFEIVKSKAIVKSVDGVYEGTFTC